MKKIVNFFKWLFGYNKPNFKKTENLLNQEEKQIKELQKSVNQIKVIHEEISNKLIDAQNLENKKKLVINPRISTSQLRRLLIKNDVFETKDMSRKERQFYAKKIHFLRNKVGMNIVFDKSNKSYKYFLHDN
jgi:hypothetical protein